MLDKLEQRGLVERDRPAENRRMVRVGITEGGIALLAEIHGPLLDCHSRQLGHLSRSQLNDLSRLLRAAREPHEPEGSAWS
jgi:DNA-binding MarR family transcriptional regulator